MKPLQFTPVADDGDEIARAELYGLLARLFYRAPDAELLERFSVAVTEAPQRGSFLEDPWNTLVGALRGSSVQALSDEYEALFLGLGKPEVFVYGSYYLSGFLNETPLVRLREDLAVLGLARDSAMGET